MCGRYSLKVDPQKLAEAFADYAEVPNNLPTRYNIAPTQDVAVIANNKRHQVEFFRWGLIPSWAKDSSIGNRLINARSETLVEKPSFKSAYRRRRCLVLADGFYEWRRNPNKTKTPMYIRLASGEPFAFAGLWEAWHSPQDEFVLSCTIITTEPNDLLETIHNRMPVILPPEAYARWLDPAETPAQELQGLLVPYPAEEMTAFEVSTLVNSPQNDSPEVVIPA